MGDIIREGRTRIDQHAALHWAWTVLGYHSKKKATVIIRKKLTELAHSENVDFEALIKKIGAEG